jgi:glycosyltransferase involved in cell wall biosynthesis
MTKKLKVLHIVNGLGFGGAETWLLEMVKRNRGQVQFDFLLTGGVERELDSEFRNLDCQLHYVNFSWNSVHKFVRSFNRIIKTGKYTVIHDHEDFVAGWHWFFLLFRLPPVRIAHAHNSMIFINNYANSLPRKLFYKTGKLLNGLLATHITGTSNQLMQELGYDKRLYQHKRIDPLYCGAAPDAFKFNEAIREEVRQKLGLSATDKLIMFIGRIGLTRENEINHKNPEFAFSIAMQLASEDPSCKFLFVGEKGKLGESMEETVKNRGLVNNIFITGKRKDANQLMIASDLLLFTSTKEPFGLVLVEAQFSSLPIIASDIITRETVLFPELLHLFDVAKADKSEWVNAIRTFFTSGYKRKAFSINHEKEIDNSIFSTEASYQRLLKTYKG